MFARGCEREAREVELRRLELEQKYKYESQLVTSIKSKCPKYHHLTRSVSFLLILNRVCYIKFTVNVFFLRGPFLIIF